MPPCPYHSPPPGYGAFLADLKTRVRSAQLRAAVSVNSELVKLYWSIGKSILEAQRREGWGAKVVERLAADLRSEFPSMSGFSRTNLLYMREFAKAWPEFQIVQQPVGQLPWGHNLMLLSKLRQPELRTWYARKSIESGWSRDVLRIQIESRLHEREGKALTNFRRTLPDSQSDLAQQLLEDPYNFDFLTLSGAARERELEQGLMDHIQSLLVELGIGFAFVGRQVRFELDGKEYVVDLLFYHLKLRCFVVVDLKATDFKPEFAGKLNFYLSWADDHLRHPSDAPTIGLLLTSDKHRMTVEYALRDLHKPIGAAGWKTRILESLPNDLRGTLPTSDDLGRALSIPNKEDD